MKKEKNMTKILLAVMLATYVLAVCIGGLSVGAYQAAPGPAALAVGAAVVLAAGAAVVFLAFRFTGSLHKTITGLQQRCGWFQSILDGIPFPVHVTDNDMKWTFMNRAFEKLMVDSHIVKNRESSYGMDCSNASANICNTENCGIRQLHKGVGQSYFDWFDMNCKQDTSYVLNEAGEKIGYVEVVTDLTSLIRLNKYNAKESKRIRENLRKLAEGNLELDFSIGEADEYTKGSHEDFISISNDLKKVKDAIGRMVQDAEMLTKAATDGTLSKRADAASHSGEYRKVVEGVNKTLDAVVGPLAIAAQYVDRISKGDIPEPIQDTYNGDFSIIKNNLNTCIAAINNMVEDSEQLAQAGIDGNLSTRADVSRHSGHFKKIVGGVNKTLDAVIQPMNKAKEVLTRISVNNLEEKMDDNYKGDFKVLAEAINMVRTRLLSVEDAFIKVSKGDTSRLEEFQSLGKRSENDRLMPAAIAMMQNIRDLSVEAKRLAEATVDGNLKERGNAQRFEGGYREIIEGMNRTMLAVEEPFKEISGVLSRMADGDRKGRVQGRISGYQG